MPAGQSQITTVGQPGQRTLTYRVTTVDGKETSRELVTDAVIIAPVTEIASVGTYVEPQHPSGTTGVRFELLRRLCPDPQRRRLRQRKRERTCLLRRDRTSGGQRHLRTGPRRRRIRLRTQLGAPCPFP
ncbi:G5 domain-containing protein [Microbacterium sp. cf046]|uniref:G5 domain-containing protein n=1 Tax=Microbacterium sp. cf046 TaxID=1761803 RepID=UPI0020C85FC9|nr:G5 domain-containing protein [Microbacterium sp. cf046]